MGSGTLRWGVILCLPFACGRIGFDPGSAEPDADPTVSDANLPSEQWWDDGWQTRQRLSINYEVGETLDSYPLLLSLTSSNIDFDRIASGGSDIRFVDSALMPLDYEIESWDGVGNLASIWVRVPQISAGSINNHLWLYYNNSGAADAQTASAVWDANFSAVWHLGESGDEIGADYLDSASYGHHMLGGAGDSAWVPTLDPLGRISGAQTFLGDDYLYAPKSASLDLVDSGGTVSGWFYLPDANVGVDGAPIFWQSFRDNPANDYGFGLHAIQLNASPTLLRVHIGNGEVFQKQDFISPRTALQSDTWYYITAAWNASFLWLYLDGELEIDGAPRSVSMVWPNIAGTLIGRGNHNGANEEYFRGSIDEIRVSNTIRSGDWNRADYRSQNPNSDFVTFGPQQRVGDK